MIPVTFERANAEFSAMSTHLVTRFGMGSLKYRPDAEGERRQRRVTRSGLGHLVSGTDGCDLEWVYRAS
jgi:hypothetical protein